MSNNSNKFIVIVGPTASGKTDMAIKLATKYKGEIICADSRTVYQTMDIGTAKPTTEQRQQINHYCLDLVAPSQHYSVAHFKKDAMRAKNNIYKKNKLPFLVGGSGLYIYSVVYNYDLERKDERTISRSLSLEELQKISIKLNLNPSEQTLNNKQHLIRFIERNGEGSRENNTDALIIGLLVDNKDLQGRIENRVHKMFDDGLVEETKNIIDVYGSDCRSLSTPGYRAVVEYLQNRISKKEAVETFIKNDKNLAKRQMTWFRNNKDIHWINNINEAEQLINNYLIQ